MTIRTTRNASPHGRINAAILIAGLLLSIATLTPPTYAAERLALVIGNGAYANASLA